MSYGDKVIRIEIPESSRLALTEGKWDALSMLKANASMVKEVTGRLPYMKGFTN